MTETTFPDAVCPENEFPDRGGKYAYNRLVDYDKDGSIPLSQIADDEVIVWPQMIYKQIQ